MQLAKNKKAYFDYEILETYEAGLVLHGYEVKAIRAKQANLKGSYITTRNGEVWVDKLYISPYQAKNQPEENGSRKRKLLLNRREIAKIENHLNTKGIAAVPLKLFLKNNRIKLTLGICRGKKQHDKRHTIKNRDLDRQMARLRRSR